MSKTLYLTQLALLTAVMFVFELTGIGYIPIPPLTLSIMALPVVIGAVTMGKGAGVTLGFVFGVTSMMQCFGKNLLGTFLFSSFPLRTIAVNVGVRILVGFFTAVLYEFYKKHDKRGYWSYIAAGATCALLNTILYMGALALIFGAVPEVQEAFLIPSGELVSIGTFFLIAMGIVLINAIVEAVVSAVAGGTLAKVLDKLVNKNK